MNFSFLILLTSKKISFHLLDSPVMLIRLLLEFPCIIEFDKINSFLNILKFFLVSKSDLLIASSELVDSLHFFRVVSNFLDERRDTHWLI